VRGLDVTAPLPSVTEALAEEATVVGDGVELVVTDGVPHHGLPSQSQAMVRGPDARCAAQDAATSTGDPLAPCARAAPPTMEPPPCAVCGGVERSNDQGIMRCVTCWPLVGRRTHVRADVDASVPGAIRGDLSSMPDKA
jgi:hypothetical protein